MATMTNETIPTTWDEARDAAFFRITAHLFDPAFCAGASVLLDSSTPDEPTWSAGDPRPRALEHLPLTWERAYTRTAAA